MSDPHESDAQDTLIFAGPPSGTGAAIDLGTVVDGRYRVESELGRGGMGVVYLGRDTWLERHVALKMIAPSWAKDGEAASCFQREAKALASVRSPYVVQVYAFGVHQGRYFFAMEYVRGRSVLQILTEHRKHGDTIPTHRTLTILNRIAQGIDAVHAAGILHRDVKPSNIVIEEDTGRPVLVDFGLAVPGDDPGAALAIGTPQYMAPEQGGVGVPGASVTKSIDIYALGITAFEMLTGDLPFDATDRPRLLRLHARKQPPLLSSKRRELAPFDRTIARALAKDPADRYPSCTAFAEVLAAASDQWINSNLPTMPPPPGSKSKPESTSGKRLAQKTSGNKKTAPRPARVPDVAPEPVHSVSPGAPSPVSPVSLAAPTPPSGLAPSASGLAPTPSRGASLSPRPAFTTPARTPPGGVPRTPSLLSREPRTPTAEGAPERSVKEQLRLRAEPLRPSQLPPGDPLPPREEPFTPILPVSSPLYTRVSTAPPPPGDTPAPTASAHSGAGRVFHVLVVDDSPVFRKFTVQATEIAFFRRHKGRVVAVRGAGSGAEAIELATAQPPDLVILDYDMPGLDGIGTLSRLRELPMGHTARVVVLSGRVSAEHRWRFAVLGVGDFVKKPIDFRHLVDRLEAIAKRFEDSQAARAQPL